MKQDPKFVHEMDQSVAALENMARAYGAYYNRLVTDGVPSIHALAMTMLQQTLITFGQK